MVAAHTSVPVPKLYWLEESPAAIGAPFLVMEQVNGRVPFDNPPYVFGGWLLDASPAQRRELQDNSVTTLAAVHALSDVRRRLPQLSAEAGADPLRTLVDAAPRRADGPDKRRMIHFGEDSEPATPDEYVMFHAMLRAIIDGSYDWTGK